MKCPKCSYVSHDYLDACRKCNIDLVEFKQKFNLMVLQPGDLDLGEMVDVSAEGVAYRDGFHSADTTSDTPYGGSHATNGLGRKVPIAKSPRGETGSDKIPADIEVDIQFDTDNPTMSTEPGELTRTFYVPEELAKQTCNMHLPDRKEEMVEMPAEPRRDIQSDTDNPTMSTEPGGLTKMFYVGLDEMPAEPRRGIQSDTDNPAPLAENMPDLSQTTPDETVPRANPVASTQDAQYSPGNTIDMSVGKLDDCFDEFDDVQLDTTEIDHNIDLAFNLPANAATPSTIDYGVPEKALDAMMPDIANTAGTRKTPEVRLSAAQEEPFASEVASDNLADDEPRLALEVTDAPSLSAERHTGPETGRMRTPNVKEDGGEM